MDGATVERMYGTYGADVYAFVMMQVRNRALAEDITGDVFVAALTHKGHEPDTAAMARAWLFRIARNRVIDHWRRGRRWFRLAGRLAAHGAEAVDIEEVAGVRADLRNVLVALGTLGERDRTLVAMRVGGGLSYQEIGDAMGLSMNSAAVATIRALKRLRAAEGVRE